MISHAYNRQLLADFCIFRKIGGEQDSPLRIGNGGYRMRKEEDFDIPYLGIGKGV